MFWDCSERLESDVLPGYHIRLSLHRDRQSSYEPIGMAVPKHVSPAVPHTLNSLDDGLVAWRFIVKRYSASAFTFSKDKPIAILGVAEMISKILKAELETVSIAYWAGLWLQDMFRQLAWKVAQTGLRKNDHAPSWSWLSIEGPVDWQMRVDLEPKSYGRVLSAMATIAWTDEPANDSNSNFCELSADLKMWCILYPVRRTGTLVSIMSAARESCRDVDVAVAEQNGLELDPVNLDCEDIEVERLYFLPLTHAHDNHDITKLSMVDNDINMESSSFFHWSEFSDTPPENWGNRQAIVGILVQMADSQLGTYRRCGSATLRASNPSYSDDAEISDVPNHEKQAWIRRKFHLPEASPSFMEFAYQEYDPELGYLIQLV